jgi:predicted RNA binding protein YcfA (HicA-like mRNA interferase family)
MADYRRKLIKLLEKHGCMFVRHASGSHDLWQSPISGARFVVQHDLSSKVAANNVLKQAGIDARL